MLRSVIQKYVAQKFCSEMSTDKIKGLLTNILGGLNCCLSTSAQKNLVKFKTRKQHA